MRHQNQANNRPLLSDNVCLFSFKGMMHEITDKVFRQNYHFPMFTAIIIRYKAASTLITAAFVWPKAPDIEI